MRRLKEEKLRRIYQKDPSLYAEQVLKVEWWAKQQEIAAALLKYHKVLVKASHSIGKTMVAGGITNWFFDCFNPSIVLTTAPTKAQVEDLLWKEVRTQRGNRPGLMPKAARMETAPNHFAAGYTAKDADSFQGRHEERVLIIFDEGTGVDAPFWTAAEGMMTGDECYWLVILNPTDTACKAYEEEQGGDWHVITVSGLDHPNIAAELAGQPPPCPAAVRLSWLEKRIEKWCTPINAEDKKAGDVEFPPQSGKWHRPGPLFEGRVLGRWPTNLSTSVWSDALWDSCLIEQPLSDLPTKIGCDVARYGDDFTAIHVRRGNCSLHHESHNGWSTSETAGRLKQLAKEYAQENEDPKTILITIDDDGVGGGVVDQAGGYNFVGLSAGSRAHEQEDYPNQRSELWFVTSGRAQEGRIDVSRLDKETRLLLKRQFMAPKWKLDSQGRRVVEPKDDTKKRIGRSPDDADAFNLAFATPPPPMTWDVL